MVEDPIARLAETIRSHPGDFVIVDGEELLDCLWYLQRNRHVVDAIPGQAEPEGESGAATEKDPGKTGQKESASQPGAPPAEPGPATEKREQSAASDAYAETGREPTVAGHKVRIPEAAALPAQAQIARALKPLSKRLSCETRHWDVEKMVEFYGESNGLWQPFFSRRGEAFTEVVIVSENSGSLRFWNPLLDELEETLHRQARLPVLRYALEHGSHGRLTLRRHRGLGALPAGGLKCHGRRRIILFFTDGISPAWEEDGAAPALLADWARTHPVTIVTPYSAKMRLRTRLRQFDPAPAAVWEMEQARWARFSEKWPVFFLPLTAERVSAWAGAIAGRGFSAALALPGAKAGSPIPWPPARRDPDAEPPPVDADEVLRRFRRRSHPHTRALARSLAAVPLYPPVMRLVREGAVPGSDHSCLAEFLLSGLIYLQSPSPHPERCLYEFRAAKPGQRPLRDQLLDTDTREELEQIWRVVGNHVDYLGHSLGLDRGGFEAFIEGNAPGSAGGTVSIDKSLKPFARIRGQVLVRLDREQAKVGRVLLEAAKDAESAQPVKPPAVEISSQGATSSRTAFTNSLGMPFLPVPGLDGVLFCQWQTRVQDYAAFAAENPDIDMSWKNYEYQGHKQGPDHPVINVSWEDAVAFCQWLSKKEGRAYRLPTDHEWSVAVGIGDQEDPKATPQAKDYKIKIYPWGTQWPPPEGSGNFAGEECKIFSGWTVIEGYRDKFPFTAPVGSFKLEHHGIKDLSGNVWEWCQDWYDNDYKHRVLRGGSWNGLGARSLASSYRPGGAPSYRNRSLGFRCVCGVG